MQAPVDPLASAAAASAPQSAEASAPLPAPGPQGGEPEFPQEAATSSPGHLMLHMPVDVRSVSLALLAVLASLFVLHWAKEFFIPFMLGLMLSYALSPIVNWAEGMHIPRWLSAMLLLISLIASFAGTVYSLRDDARDLIESLPLAAQKMREAARTSRQGPKNSALETVQKAATQIEQAAQESGAAAAPTRGVTRVVIEKSKFNITDYLWTGTMGLMTLAGQAMMVIFLTFFMMVAGDTFRRKLVKVAGPTLHSKKITLQALNEITHQIQRYLQVQLVMSVLTGVLTWLALLAIGLENAAVWGIAAGVLNFIPYVGAIIIMGSSALVGFLQFETVNMALLVAGVSLVIHTVVGNLLTPWLTSRAGRMNPVAVFVGLLAWGWLWGVWGLLLGVPILMVVKAICDRIDDLNPIGEFLGS